MQAFVDAVAAKKLPSEVDTFIAPFQDAEQAIAELDDVAKIVAKPKLRILATHVAKSGTAAWIVAQISGGKYQPERDKTSTAPLRASAFLTLDGGKWHVRAAHWSGTKPNRQEAQVCGAIDPGYEPPPYIAKGAEPAVKVITEAFAGKIDGEGTAAQVLPALSDDKAAQMFGSAPGETFTGAAAVKKVFKGWKIDLGADTGEHTRAGIAPGGDLAWVAMEVMTFWQCTAYRTLFVLQKEGGAWKIVHQHYSERVLAP
jgi:ketosteroid isomerase-like protein